MTYSDLTDNYSEPLGQLRETCAQLLNTFPPRLQQPGEAILQRGADTWHRVNWVQPFVLNADWFVSDASLDKIALAHALTGVHAHIQEAAIHGNGGFNGDLLPLGSLLYTHALGQYQRVFAPTAQFWRLLEGYHLEWTESIFWARQRQRQWGAVRRYSQEEILQTGGVRALSKIGCSAVALISGKQRVLMPLSSILDQLHVAIQLVDGVVHWQQDLQKKRATYFLTEAALALNVQTMDALQRPDLEEFLITCNLPAKAIGRALDHLQAAQKIAARLDTPNLVGYLEELEAIFRRIPHLLASKPSDAHVFMTATSISALF
jgi:hypothetical protein